MMIDRSCLPGIELALRRNPAVVLLGPRQVGKSTLARDIAARHPGAIFMDLERDSDRAALQHPELFFPPLRDRLVVLDEVQTVPELFRALRPEIDADRRVGRLLLLGSASGPLLQQSSESLAGRVSYLELTPFLAQEVTPDPADLAGLQRLWMRGGYPLSHLAASDGASLAWRQDLVRTFLQRDVPALGLRVPAEALRRFWTMLAHLQGQLFNASQLGLALGGASHTTVIRHLDLLVDALMVRRLAPHLPHVGKRLVKSPKVYVRDSGLLHALLGIPDAVALQGHPVAGLSWEGFVIEQIAAALPADAVLGHYRTAAGAEIDLVAQVGGRTLAFEIKLSSAPKPARGFWQALADVRPDQAYVVAPVARAYSLADGVQVMGVAEVARSLAGG